ncbi:MAG: hypothetical protein HGB12_03775, partial [Bacteroidetes bacterium]|nr:hypothetical protein [Bacteroidota bacterium]
MKRFLYIIFLFFIGFHAFSQQYGNEWINYNNQYFRIFVYSDGIYRIDSTALANSGINVSNINPKNIQIFGRGVQQYIYIKGESDNHFNSGDYIEFYGEHNDGWYDYKLFANPSDQPNPAYSMFNDTAVYYLTINQNSVSNFRMISENDTLYSSYSATPYFNKVTRTNYTGTYFFGETDGNGVTDPEYVPSEGWFDAGFNLGSSITKNIATTNVFNLDSATIEFLLIGASNYSGVNPNHHVNINFAGIEIDTTLFGYYTKRYNIKVPASSLGSASTAFSFSSINDINCYADYNTISYINIKYPHKANLENQSSYVLYVPNSISQNKTYLNLSNFSVTANDSVWFYDITNHKRIKVKKNGTNYQVLIPNAVGEKKCYITSVANMKIVNSIQPVNTDLGNYAKFTDYSYSPEYTKSDYLIVTHKKFWNEAQDYKDYRSSSEGGSYSAMIADIEELYDQFSYGIRKNPLAIKNFANFALDFYQNRIKDLFLIGKGYRAAESDANRCYRKNS